ncbi:hypothetical protein EC973_005045 [Apophysomyces ossiformis]|uniref:Auxin efflux carrier n=1 Tax=Apophysomyces ossiformis TaxID=679940 RepID=A0A8H7BRW7_9FUNG|nr:hypothetical protein EC973_005045 [Apophysomyces ossiformis]
MSEAGKILYWKPDDTRETVSARGFSYALFFGLFSNVLRWSYGYNVLQAQASDKERAAAENTMPYYGTTARSSDELSYDSDLERLADDDIRRMSAVTIAAVDHNIPKTPDHERTRLLSSSPPYSSTPTEIPSPPLSVREHIHQRLQKTARSIHGYMSPPLYAAIVALFVGLIPPLKEALYSKQSFFYPSFTKAVESCAKPAVPVILLCLGSQLSTITARHFPSRVVVTTIITRMFLIPLSFVPIVIWFAKYGSAWSAIASDPAFLVIMVVLGCTPTAINLIQITQVSGYCQEEMLELLFWSYGVICIPVCTLVIFVALAAVDRVV